MMFVREYYLHRHIPWLPAESNRYYTVDTHQTTQTNSRGVQLSPIAPHSLDFGPPTIITLNDVTLTVPIGHAPHT